MEVTDVSSAIDIKNDGDTQLAYCQYFSCLY